MSHPDEDGVEPIFSEQMTRIQSIDILRGVTIALMVVVNNPGNWDSRYASLCHASWNGLTLTDLVFPLFLFMMGVSMRFSLSKDDFRLSWKILRRTLVLILLGFALNWISVVVWRRNYSLDALRFTGVLQRFGFCFGLSAIIVCLLPRKSIPVVIMMLLAGYSMALLLGDGYVYGPENIIARVDRALIPPVHLMSDHGIDPEGIFSTIPCLAHTLIGFCIGKLIAERKQIKVLLWGINLLAAGILLAICLPLNKKIWSPSFVFVACGIGTLALCALYYLVDEKKFGKWSFFKSFGENAIYCYIVNVLLSWTLMLAGLQPWVSANLAAGRPLISFAWSLFVVVLVWGSVLPFYKMRISIRV